MADLESVEGVPVWHPPLWVLDAAELVVIGALDEMPADLPVPDDLAGAPALVLEDAEGTPVARLEGRSATALRPFTHGPARAARRTPAQVRQAVGEALVVPVTAPLTDGQVKAALAQARARPGGGLVWLGIISEGRSSALPPSALARALAALTALTALTGSNDADLNAVSALVAVPVTVSAESVVHAFGPVVAGLPAEEASPHPAFDAELRRVVRPPDRRGVTVFFTGLSGSGKSTVAKALAERIDERTGRTVSLLDGDEVRRLLSAGLTFSRADRDLNIRRIGFVAAEVTRHGGLAVCAPIAPFEQARAQVRTAVEEVGDFVLVHVSTPLAECERRDRKGLYAKARQGLIPDFTGISSPYEVPVHAELRLDTSRMTLTEAVDVVWGLLVEAGYLGPDQLWPR